MDTSPPSAEYMLDLANRLRALETGARSAGLGKSSNGLDALMCVRTAAERVDRLAADMLLEQIRKN